MPQDLDRRPLARRRPGPEVLAGLRHQLLGLIREAGGNLGGVAVAQHPEQHPLVLVRPGHRVDLEIQRGLGLRRVQFGHVSILPRVSAV